MNGRKGYEKEKKKQQLHELHAIHSRGTRFKSFMSKCYMPQASFTPYLLSQTSDRLEG